MKHVSAVPLVVALAGCPTSTTPMTGATSMPPPGGPTATANGNITIPNVFGLTRDAAIAELRRAGFQGTPTDDGSLCDSTVDGRVIEIGQVCYQHPPAGRVQGARLPVSLRVQTENPWHGNVGKVSEWRLMPNVIGKHVEQARAEMKRVGFSREDRVRLQWVDEPSCQPLIVCRTYPEPMQRAGVSSDKIVFVGRDPSASKPAEPTTPDRAKPDPKREPAEQAPPTPDAPKPEPRPEPFF